MITGTPRDLAPRRTAIVGAGQAGLILGTSLLASGHQVSIYTNRTAEDVRSGPVMSSQCLFGATLAMESRLGLNFWDHECPRILGMDVSAALPEDPHKVITSWAAAFRTPAQSVDQRVKMSTWLDEITRRGATVEISDITTEHLPEISSRHDYSFVTAGKGDLVNVFPQDQNHCPDPTPRRQLAMFYVHDRRPADNVIRFHSVPTVGEFLSYPALTVSGRCRILLLEIVPGSPIDVFDRTDIPSTQLGTLRTVVERYFPCMTEYLNDDLVDESAALIGAVRPTVRRPWTTVEGHVWAALGDAQCVNDPITAQGANNATKAAAIYANAIATTNERFSPELIERIHATVWSHLGPALALTEHNLGDKPDYAHRLHLAAAQHPHVAHRFAELMNDPRDALSWVLDPYGAHAYLDAVGATASLPLLSA